MTAAAAANQICIIDGNYMIVEADYVKEKNYEKLHELIEHYRLKLKNNLIQQQQQQLSADSAATFSNGGGGGGLLQLTESKDGSEVYSSLLQSLGIADLDSTLNSVMSAMMISNDIKTTTVAMAVRMNNFICFLIYDFDQDDATFCRLEEMQSKLSNLFNCLHQQQQQQQQSNQQQQQLLNPALQKRLIVYGWPILYHCIENNLNLTSVTDVDRPLYCKLMSGCFVCFTGFKKENKHTVAQCIKLVHYMGGSVRKEYNKKITHLIVKSTLSTKYKTAYNIGKCQLLTEDWIVEAWKHRNEITFNVNDEDFLKRFKLKALYSLSIAFYGFTKEETQHMKEVTIENGGTPINDINDPQCTHIVINDQEVKQLPTAICSSTSALHQTSTAAATSGSEEAASTTTTTTTASLTTTTTATVTPNSKTNNTTNVITYLNTNMSPFSNTRASVVRTEWFWASIQICCRASECLYEFTKPTTTTTKSVDQESNGVGGGGGGGGGSVQDPPNKRIKLSLDNLLSHHDTLNSSATTTTTLPIAATATTATTTTMTGGFNDSPHNNITSKSNITISTATNLHHHNNHHHHHTPASAAAGAANTTSTSLLNSVLNNNNNNNNNNNSGQKCSSSSTSNSGAKMNNNSNHHNHHHHNNHHSGDQYDSPTITAATAATTSSNNLTITAASNHRLSTNNGGNNSSNRNNMSTNNLSTSTSLLDATADDAMSIGSPFDSKHSRDSAHGLLNSASSNGGQSSSLSSKKITKRSQRIYELYETEKRFVNILHTIIFYFKEPIEAPDQVAGPILDQTEAKEIFGNLPPIYEVHCRIKDRLERLVNRLVLNEESTSVGEIYMDNADALLKTYPPFVNFYEKTKDAILNCDKVKPRFHAFLKIAQSKPECGRQTLVELLIRPVQRLPSTLLLLDDILKETPKTHRDHELLSKAIASLKEVMTHINEDKRKIENQLAMFVLINDIENCPATLLSSHRSFLKKIDVYEMSNELLKKGAQLTLFLFTDCLEICKPRLKLLNSAAKSPVSKQRTPQKCYKHISLFSLNNVTKVCDILQKGDDTDLFGILCRLAGEKDKFYSFKVIAASNCSTALMMMNNNSSMATSALSAAAAAATSINSNNCSMMVTSNSAHNGFASSSAAMLASTSTLNYNNYSSIYASSTNLQHSGSSSSHADYYQAIMEKKDYLKLLAQGICNVKCITEYENILCTVEAQQLQIDLNESGGLKKLDAVKSYARRVSRAFSFQDTPNKIKKTISSVFRSPFQSYSQQSLNEQKASKLTSLASLQLTPTLMETKRKFITLQKSTLPLISPPKLSSSNGAIAAGQSQSAHKQRNHPMHLLSTRTLRNLRSTTTSTINGIAAAMSSGGGSSSSNSSKMSHYCSSINSNNNSKQKSGKLLKKQDSVQMNTNRHQQQPSIAAAATAATNNHQQQIKYPNYEEEEDDENDELSVMNQNEQQQQQLRDQFDDQEDQEEEEDEQDENLNFNYNNNENMLIKPSALKRSMQHAYCNDDQQSIASSSELAIDEIEQHQYYKHQLNANKTKKQILMATTNNSCNNSKKMDTL